ncbi:MAG TPA: ATP-binding protein [Spirochaetota bacterium]|nr:tRNA 2-thiocytidine(32) synthetase TtcA [Spirochaetota bacterium]HOD15877.1 ATP-binding protein [Spirochaetota bacterium]HPG51054.1 ATP-binding protein [Spirochaetota bacterium]HPN11616.1 ATP-binding protein [Spirochaetota bacterium]
MTSEQESRYLLRVQKTVGRAVNRYGLIQANDRIAVGVSGGKDSIVLLESLAVRRKWIPIHYDICAVHIEVKSITRAIDRDYYENFCRELGVSFETRGIEVDLTRDPDKTVCFVCAWHRRKELFHAVKELGCNRLALGHHMDDALETLLLNMTYNGTMSSMPPKLSMFGGEFDIIRPLILLHEKEIERYARIRGFPVERSQCPYGSTTRRADMKRIVGELSKMNRKAKNNLYAAMSNIHREHLPPG